MTREEKLVIVHDLKGADLLKAYDTYRDKFNPLDDEFIENFNIIKDEVLDRLNKED